MNRRLNDAAISEQLWNIRFDAVTASRKVMNGEYDKVTELMRSIDSRVAEVKRQLSSHPDLIRTDTGD